VFISLERWMRNKNKNIMLDLEKITLNVREIALRAGAFLRNERSGFDRSKVEKKNAHDYVSYVDKESERRIVAQLRELLPEAGFIAEEGSGSLTTENYCWLVDPLDGTTNFIHNNAPYCVSIALRKSISLWRSISCTSYMEMWEACACKEPLRQNFAM